MLNRKRIRSNYKSQEAQFKIIQKLQTTSYCGEQIWQWLQWCSGVNVSCKQHVGTYVYLMWLCPEINTFWFEIGNQVSSIIRCPIELNPLQCILGLHAASLELNRYKRILSFLRYCAQFINLTALARWCQTICFKLAS